MSKFTVCFLLTGILALSLSFGSEPFFASRDDRSLEDVLTERTKTLQQIVVFERISYQSGNTSFGSLVEAEQDLLEAELQQAQMKDDRILLRKKALKLAKDREKQIEERVKFGDRSKVDALKARAVRLKLEADLLRETNR